MKNFAIGAVSCIIALFLGALVSGLLVNAHFKAKLEGFSKQVDTILIRDTIKHLKPVSDDSPKFTGGELKIPTILFFTDTLYREIPDTLSLPIEQRTYTDTTYKAWVSGVSPSLDSIYVFPTTTIITKPVFKERKWSFGLQGGIGLVQPFGEKFSPNGGYYLGVGVQYNF